MHEYVVDDMLHQAVAAKDVCLLWRWWLPLFFLSALQASCLADIPGRLTSSFQIKGG